MKRNGVALFDKGLADNILQQFNMLQVEEMIQDDSRVTVRAIASEL